MIKSYNYESHSFMITQENKEFWQKNSFSFLGMKRGVPGEIQLRPIKFQFSITSDNSQVDQYIPYYIISQIVDKTFIDDTKLIISQANLTMIISSIVCGLIITFFSIFNAIQGIFIVYKFKAPLKKLTEVLKNFNTDFCNETSKTLNFGPESEVAFLQEHFSCSMEMNILFCTVTQVFSTIQLANEAYFTGDSASSLIYWCRAAILFTKTGSKRPLGISLKNIANIHLKELRFDEAINYIQQSIETIDQEIQELQSKQDTDAVIPQSQQSLSNAIKPNLLQKCLEIKQQRVMSLLHAIQKKLIHDKKVTKSDKIKIVPFVDETVKLSEQISNQLNFDIERDILTYIRIASCYCSLAIPQQAKLYLEKGDKLLQKFKHHYSIPQDTKINSHLAQSNCSHQQIPLRHSINQKSKNKLSLIMSTSKEKSIINHSKQPSLSILPNFLSKSHQNEDQHRHHANTKYSSHQQQRNQKDNQNFSSFDNIHKVMKSSQQKFLEVATPISRSKKAISCGNEQQEFDAISQTSLISLKKNLNNNDIEYPQSFFEKSDIEFPQEPSVQQIKSSLLQSKQNHLRQTPDKWDQINTSINICQPLTIQTQQSLDEPIFRSQFTPSKEKSADKYQIKISQFQGFQNIYSSKQPNSSNFKGSQNNLIETQSSNQKLPCTQFYQDNQQKHGAAYFFSNHYKDEWNNLTQNAGEKIIQEESLLHLNAISSINQSQLSQSFIIQEGNPFLRSHNKSNIISGTNFPLDHFPQKGIFQEEEENNDINNLSLPSVSDKEQRCQTVAQNFQFFQPSHYEKNKLTLSKNRKGSEFIQQFIGDKFEEEEEEDCHDIEASKFESEFDQIDATVSNFGYKCASSQLQSVVKRNKSQNVHINMSLDEKNDEEGIGALELKKRQSDDAFQIKRIRQQSALTTPSIRSTQVQLFPQTYLQSTSNSLKSQILEQKALLRQARYYEMLGQKYKAATILTSLFEDYNRYFLQDRKEALDLFLQIVPSNHFANDLLEKFDNIPWRISFMISPLPQEKADAAAQLILEVLETIEQQSLPSQLLKNKTSIFLLREDYHQEIITFRASKQDLSFIDSMDCLMADFFNNNVEQGDYFNLYDKPNLQQHLRYQEQKNNFDILKRRHEFIIKGFSVISQMSENKKNHKVNKWLVLIKDMNDNINGLNDLNFANLFLCLFRGVTQFDQQPIKSAYHCKKQWQNVMIMLISNQDPTKLFDTLFILHRLKQQIISLQLIIHIQIMNCDNHDESETNSWINKALEYINQISLVGNIHISCSTKSLITHIQMIREPIKNLGYTISIEKI